MGGKIESIKLEWLLLFEKISLAIHFKELTGVNMEQAVDQAYEMSRVIVGYFKTQATVKKCNIRQVFLDSKLAKKKEETNKNLSLEAMVLLLLAHVGENPHVLFVQAVS